MLTAALLTLAVAMPESPSARKFATTLELFARTEWYAKQAGKEQEFVGVLELTPPQGTGLGNCAYYRLWTDRDVYEIAGPGFGRPQELDPHAEQKVRIIGKLTDWEGRLPGQRVIAPARLEVLSFGENDLRMHLTTLRRQKANLVTLIMRRGYDHERDEESYRAARYRDLLFLAELHQTGHHLEALSLWPVFLPGRFELDRYMRNPLEIATMRIRLRWLEAAINAVEEDLSRTGPPHCNGVEQGRGGIMHPNVLLRGEPDDAPHLSDHGPDRPGRRNDVAEREPCPR